MINISGLCKNYENKKVLSGFSMTVERDEIVALIGMEGAGKSTLLDIAAGVCDADAGKVEIDGAVIEAETSRARMLVGYAPAEAPQPRDMTVRAWLKFLAGARGLSARETQEKIDAVLKALALTDVADANMPGLTDGVLRLVNIAQAAFFGPDALLIDEPTRDLDPKDALALRQGIRTLAKGKAVILASANLSEIIGMCDRVAVLKNGAIAAWSDPDSLHLAQARSGGIRLLVRGEEAAARSALKELKDVSVTGAAAEDGALALTLETAGDQREALWQALSQAGIPVLEMSSALEPLDQVIASLVSDRFREAPQG